MAGADRHARAARTFYAVAATLGVAAVYVVHAAIPPNPIRLPAADRVKAGAFLPEGWAFFTKTPRTPEVVVLRRKAGRWVTVRAPRLSAAGPLNFDRGPRAQGVEIGLLFHEIPDVAWTMCESRVADCLTAAPLSATVVNVVPSPTLCNEIGFAQRQRVPWSFRHTTVAEDMPSVVVRVVVSCP